MSEYVANLLDLTYDPTRILSMQSVNRNTNRTLGLARNVSFTIGGLTLHFQVHVIREAAYDILLGRPFDIFITSIVHTISKDQLTITIHCPNTSRVAVVPTFERGRCMFSGKRAGGMGAHEQQDF